MEERSHILGRAAGVELPADYRKFLNAYQGGARLTDGVMRFNGIPYAKPPVGALRWQMPEPAEPWTGVRDASRFGNIAPRLGFAFQPKANSRFVLRGNETFCLVRPRGETLALETLFLAEDVRSQAEIEEAVGETEVKDAELDLARQVIDGLAADFEPNELESTYRRDLRALLEAKLSGAELKKPEPEPDAPVIDLMDALRASVAQAAKKKAADAPKPSRSRKTAAAGSRKR